MSDSGKSNYRFFRRNYLKLFGAVGLSGLAGCNEDKRDRSPPDDSTETTNTSEQEPAVANPIADIALVYNPGNHPDWSCVDGVPEVGRYREQSTGVTNRHVNLVRRFGGSRLLIQLNDESDRGGIDALREADSSDILAMTFVINLKNQAKRGRSITAQTRRVSEYIQEVDSYDTHNDRPVVHLSGLEAFRGQSGGPAELRDQLFTEFESLSEMVDRIRDILTIEEKPPFLVGNVGTTHWSTFDQISTSHRTFLSAFDALTNGLSALEDDEWTKAIRRVTETFRTSWTFAESNDLEFIPRIYPGKNQAVNSCDEGAKDQLSRDPDRFSELLEIAGVYATTERLIVESFDGWSDGTQLEPGRFGGNDYDTAYLRRVQKFQQTGSLADHLERETYHVSPDGFDGNSGSLDEPLAMIDEGLRRARPGVTVRIHPGEYYQDIMTYRAGQEEEPIILTGPEDAVVRGENPGRVCWLRHSHVHITGLTFNGLVDKERPEQAISYRANLIKCHVWGKDAYVENLKILPHGVGNCRGDAINLSNCKEVEIGEFRVIGPVGVDFKLDEKYGHNAEVVYIGDGPEFEGIRDETSDVHVHHIDGSQGYYHTELVDVKAYCHDITIEYCTSANAGLPTDAPGSTAMHLGSHDSTFRWNRIDSAADRGLDVGNYGLVPDTEITAINNSVYGNQFVDLGGNAIAFAGTSEEDQKIVCGNEVMGPTEGDPDKPCSDTIPEGDGIGHLGGDSPWA